MSTTYEAAVQRRLLEMAEANAALRGELRLVRVTLSAMRHTLLENWQQQEIHDLLARIDRVLKATDGKVS